MMYPSLILLFLLGLSLGSFINAAEWRLRMGIPLKKKRSMCPACNHTLAPMDLIPVVSFFLLKGHCRYCNANISWQYPLVELWLGLAFVCIGWIHLNTGMSIVVPSIIHDACILFSLTFLFIYDFKYQELPDCITIPSILIIGLSSYVHEWLTGPQLLIGAAVGGGVFLFQYLISKGTWIGGGDIRLGVLMGVILGWPVILVALFLAYVGGSLVAVPLLLMKKSTWKTKLPFGTFLTIATVASMMWGQTILEWYLSLIKL